MKRGAVLEVLRGGKGVDAIDIGLSGLNHNPLHLIEADLVVAPVV